MLGAMDVPGRWAGGFRAWDDHGVYLATGRAAVARPRPQGAVPSRSRTGRAPGSRSAAHLIEGLFRTARNFEAMTRQREALVALGTLAAGLAHEINNPAAAATRAVDALRRRLRRAAVLARAGSPRRRSRPTSSLALDALRREIEPPPAGTRSAGRRRPRGRRVDLARRATASSRTWLIAPPLARGGRRRRVVRAGSRSARRRRARAGPGVGGEHAVGADAARRGEGVDPAHLRARRGGEVLLAARPGVDAARPTSPKGSRAPWSCSAHKIPAGVTVVRDYAADVPRIEAIAGELNQVWTNLIDNAIDAMDGSGTLRVSTRADGGRASWSRSATPAPA